MNKDLIFVHSARLAGWLMLNGFMFKELINDKKRDNKYVFVFCDTPDLRDAMRRYSNNVVRIRTTL